MTIDDPAKRRYRGAACAVWEKHTFQGVNIGNKVNIDAYRSYDDCSTLKAFGLFAKSSIFTGQEYFSRPIKFLEGILKNKTVKSITRIPV
jgi:hypothetical protein